MSKKFSFSYINKLAVPAIIAGIVEPILSLTDTAIVGNVTYNSKEALAAVGIAGSFIATLAWVCSQSRVAIVAIVAEYLGKKKLDKVATLPAQIIWINILLGLAVCLITNVLAVEIFKLYHADGVLLEYTSQYYRIRVLGFPFLLISVSIFAVFRGLQNTFWPMVVSATGAVINIVLDYVLVYGIDGYIPAMHIAGAAWASLIAQVVMGVFSLILFFTKTPFSLAVSNKVNSQLKRLAGISLNMLIRTIALNLSLILANVYATKYGEKYIAAFTIAYQLWLFFAFFIDGYASVSGIVSGKLKGENDFKSLRILVNTVVKYSVVVSLILMTLFALGYNYIGGLFTNDIAVIETFKTIFWMVLLMQPINAVAFVYDDLFKGLAEAVKLRNVILAATFLGFVPTLYISDYFNLHVYGIWLAFLVWMLIRAFVLWRQFPLILKQK